jgi:protein SCO1/2
VRRSILPVCSFLLFLFLVATLTAPVSAHGPEGEEHAGEDQETEEPSDRLPGILASATFDQHPGDRVPLDLTFRDDSGERVSLGQYFGDKPVILTMNYYECDTLCPLVMEGVVRGLNGVPFTMGEEFNLITLSIDPRETPEQAAEVKEHLVHMYGRDGAANEWDLLTGEQEQIEQLAKAVGFNYVWDEETQQYAHPSGAIVLTPDGTIARYIYGVEFNPRDLRLALVEASEGRISSPVDAVLLFCFHYDAAIGKYSAIAFSSMRIGGAATLVVLGGFLWTMFRRERANSLPTGTT